MEKPVEVYWEKKLAELKEQLEKNNFEVFVAENCRDAEKIVLDTIIPQTGATTASWGGSLTFSATGMYEAVRDSGTLEVLDTYDKSFTPEEALERRRQSLLTDLYITGTNAVTEDGTLVNLDMIGNRVAAITFGPKNVIILVGRNKIVPDLEAAADRIKNYAAPVNVMRLDKKAPCLKAARCMDCNSPERICNTWTITEKSFPAGRVKVVLINEELGF